MANERSFVNVLDGGWLARRASDVAAQGEEITSPDYEPVGWLPAVVPGSVLATLVVNGQQPDPYVGDASLSIPDLSQAGGLAYYTFWFYRTFDLQETSPAARTWLRFDGINYAADVYLDGRKLDAKEREGMFHRRTFEISGLAPGKHRLAVRVFPPDPPGKPGPNGGAQSAPNIGASVTARYPVGWDWVIAMPDRSAGIWDKVSLIGTGPVTLGDPHVVSKVPGIRVPDGPQAPAELTVTAALRNTSESAISGILECAVDGEFAQVDVNLAPGETRRVPIHFQLYSPRLWWPNGMGEPYLHESALTFCIAGEVSDRRTFNVGVRQVDVAQVDLGGRSTRVFTVNGQRVFLRGGNWIGTDAMFRYCANAKRYHDEVRLHASANLNLIRVWGGGIAERDPFYDACDAHGILVMQDFWISGEYDPEPSERWVSVFRTSARDTIERLQHHASLLFWCGGNEQVPPRAVASQLAEWIQGPAMEVLDGSRLFVDRSTNISGSSSDQYEDGPYGIMPLAAFEQERFSNPINPELGSIGTPTYDSLSRFLPASALADFPKPNQPYDKVNATWRHHDYIPYHNDNPQVPDQIATYGAPNNVKRFAYLAQLANYAQYRALFEGFTAHAFEWYAGVLLWKSQNPWPGLRGQIYDWYLEQTGGMFGVQHACEPVHVQLSFGDASNPKNTSVLVTNTTPLELTNITATATTYALDGTVLAKDRARKDLPAGSIVPMFSIEQVPRAPGVVYFIDLRLTDAYGTLVSRNFYWQSTDGSYQPLNELKPAHIEATATMLRDGERWHASVTLVNGPDQPVAFCLQLQVRDSGLGNRVLPVFYEDNYLSLVPGERRDLTVDFATTDVPSGTTPELWCAGWNVTKTHILASF
jgi:mannosylglycoprotein endo-beta-mannosidase